MGPRPSDCGERVDRLFTELEYIHAELQWGHGPKTVENYMRHQRLLEPEGHSSIPCHWGHGPKTVENVARWRLQPHADANCPPFNGATARRPWENRAMACRGSVNICMQCLQWGHGPKIVENPASADRCCHQELELGHPFNGATVRRRGEHQGLHFQRLALRYLYAIVLPMGPRPGRPWRTGASFSTWETRYRHSRRFNGATARRPWRTRAS